MAFTAADWGQGRLLTGLTPGSTLSGFTAVITKDNLPTTALDGGALSCLNGGGDWRFSTDILGANQIPCEIVTCVTNATPANTEFVAWIRFPSYALGTREVYAFWNKAGESQPLFAAPFGRDEVWADYAISAHLDQSSGTVATDSAGKRDGTYNGALPTLGADFGQDLNGTTDYANFGNASLGIASAFTFSVKIKPDTIGANQQIFTADDTGVDPLERNWQWRVDADGKVRIISFDSGGSVIVSSAGTLSLLPSTEYILHYVWDGAAYKSYINGLEDYSFSSITNINDLSGLGFGAAIGARKGVSVQNFFDGQVGDLQVLAGSFKTPDLISSEYTNQSDPLNFWTLGTVFVPGGGAGITITGSTAAFDYSAIAGVVDLTGSIDVTGSTASFEYTAIAGTIDLTGAIAVIGNTASFDYTAIAGDIDLTGSIDITGATAAFDYTAINGVIELGAVINVVGSTASFDYNGIAGGVTLTGEILVTGQTATFNYTAYAGRVIIGEGQKIGTVTAGFADSGINVQYKQNTITVNFGE